VTSLLRRAGALCAVVLAVSASAQILPPGFVFPNPNTNTTTDAPANRAFPLQNPQGPSGTAYQVNYPYPGQCLADPAKNGALFPQAALVACPAVNSFSCVAAGISNQSAGGWSTCGAPFGFKVLSPIVPNSVPLLATATATPKFVWEVLNPPDYTPDNAANCNGTNCPLGGTYPGADYYEIGLHEAWGFQTLASVGAFPLPPATRPAVPGGMQWTGLVCNNVDLLGNPVPCTCPAGLAPTFEASYCSIAGPPRQIPHGAPLYTPIWGVGQKNIKFAAPVAPAGPAVSWSPNDYFATWPSISIRAKTGTPVVVKWTNEFPNNHVLCPHPEVADWPCAIDRTFMGVKPRIDPAAMQSMVAPVVPEGVNIFGSPQQPDNSWVTHLHGGEIPPSTDGFAEKWFGNLTTAAKYSPVAQMVNPAFESPLAHPLMRPAGNSDVYTYPMVQEEATIWFHDHTLGKTHHNVIAGPAGFFPVKDPAKHGAITAAWVPGTPLPAGADYTWLDPVTEPRTPFAGVTNFPTYDLFLAIQDRSFNDDGTINFSNGLGQTIPPPPAILPGGYTPVTNGVNPLVHPTWVPEYFGDHALVNGVLWPKKQTEPGWYRMRIVDGSDSRCYSLGFQRSALPPAPGAKVNFNVPFYVIANDQGYLQTPVPATGNNLTMCPGERYEILVNFGNLPGIAAGGAADVYMVNNAPAPFPAGITPQALASPFAEMNVIMKFQVSRAFGPGVKSCGATVTVGGVANAIAPTGLLWDPANMALNLAKYGDPGFPPPNVQAIGNYARICMPNLAVVANRPTDPSFVGKSLLAFAALPTTVVRQVYLNEKVDGVTLAPLGMQLNGVPFEYKVTETPKLGTKEVWKFVNLTVDAHPMHPHLVQHQIVSRQSFNVGAYKARLCGSTTCQPGTAPGGEMQVVPDVTANLTAQPVPPLPEESGFKDATQAPPRMVTTIIADWTPRWSTAGFPLAPPASPAGTAAPFSFEPATSGPYVWHCHINSHEDSEMMRTSLVVP